jgi:NtrC-family two-component system sensor histidine kinase KinB
MVGLAGVLLVMTTIVSGIWSAWTFARLTAVAGKTLGMSQQTIDLTAVLADALEREDDALLLAVSGEREQAQAKLLAERRRFTESYSHLLRTLDERGEKDAAAVLKTHEAQNRAASDAFLLMAGQRDAMTVYYRRVNPASVKRSRTVQGSGSRTFARCSWRRFWRATRPIERQSW